MDSVAPQRLFDIKSVLYLRLEVKNRFQKETGLTVIEWNNRNLSALSRRIAAKTEYEKGIGVRSLRTTLADPVTLHTPIPTNAASNSRIDLVCRYLDFRDLLDFQVSCKPQIEALELSSYKQMVSRAAGKAHLSEVFTLAWHEDVVPLPVCTHLLCYRQTPQGEVVKDIIVLYPETGKAEFFLISGIFNVVPDGALPESEIRENSLYYTGTYMHDVFGYIFFQLRLVDKPQFSFTGMLVVGSSLLAASRYTGAYIATSLLYGGLWSGLLVMECTNSYDDAMATLRKHTDEVIRNMLRDQVVGIPMQVPVDGQDTSEIRSFQDMS